MRLTGATVQNYKSIEDSSKVKIDPKVTVLVGQNESGKTAFLEALHKTRPVLENAKFSVTDDYPRRRLTRYERRHQSNPDTVTAIEFALEDSEVEEVNALLGQELVERLSFTISTKYDGKLTIGVTLPEQDYVKGVLKAAELTTETRKAIGDASRVKELMAGLEGLDLNSEEQAFLESLNEDLGEAPDTWSALSYKVWQQYLSNRVPKFLFFDDYYILPGKVNLQSFVSRVQAADSNGTPLSPQDQTVRGLLHLAGVQLSDLTETAGYETIKARLEGFGNDITDQVFEFWRQNRELDVEFDIRTDPTDQPPYNSGNNLYIRIRNRRHRVTVPFDQRSKGFIWFFSFLVWFGSISEQVEAEQELVLLLDEPGLSLHALAQADFLRYIDVLSKSHQILYTTHSPFMVDSEHLERVRAVTDVAEQGTKVTGNLEGSDRSTLFPLQAALGYTIAQNLFISSRNLLVEGPADLVFLRFASNVLEGNGREGLRGDITVVPTGGLDKLATFIALLAGNELEFVVLHDYEGGPDQRLQELVRARLIRERRILNYAMFRDGNPAEDEKLSPSDVEDMFSPGLYLQVFNAAYARELGDNTIKVKDLPERPRLVRSIEAFLEESGLVLRPSGGFNHYRVADHLARNPGIAKELDASTLNRFESLFRAVNAAFPT